MILTIRCKLHETRNGEHDAPRPSPEICVDDDTPPDLYPPTIMSVLARIWKSNADCESYQHRVGEPVRKDIGYVPDLVHTDRELLFLIHARTSGVPTVIDERQLRKHRVGHNVEGSEHEHDADVEEEEEVSPTTRVLAFELMPEGKKAEPEEGRDNAIARSGDECAREPCMFRGELSWRLGWGVGHVRRGARIARPC